MEYIHMYVRCLCAETKSCDLRLQLKYLKMPGKICMRQSRWAGATATRNGHLKLHLSFDLAAKVALQCQTLSFIFVLEFELRLVY